MTTFTLSDGTLITVVEWRFVPEGYNERPWTRFVLDEHRDRAACARGLASADD